MSFVAASALPWIIGVCALSVIALFVVVLAPGSRGRATHRIDREAEMRLLLGEDPNEIDRDFAQRASGDQTDREPTS